jgi:hypothetical protein
MSYFHPLVIKQDEHSDVQGALLRLMPETYPLLDFHAEDTVFENSAGMADSTPSFSPVILGNLKYHDDAHTWVLDFSHIVAQYEYLSTHCDCDPRDQARLPELIKRANSILTTHGLGEIRERSDIKDSITTIQMFIKVLLGEQVYALFLIGICSWYLGKRRTLSSNLSQSNELKAAAMNYLEEVKTRCPGVLIKTDVLRVSLTERLSNCQTTHEVRRLLRDLSRPLQVLLLTAEPKNVPGLKLLEEQRELLHALDAGKFRDDFRISDVHCCRIDEIMQALEKYRPDILQFSGHGNGEGLCFTGENGKSQLVKKVAFASLLRNYPEIKLVILNACCSQSVGQCIEDSVGCLIGMEGRIRNNDAIIFTKQFYTALGQGRTVQECFLLAKAAVEVDDTATFQARLLQKRSSLISALPSPVNGSSQGWAGTSTRWLSADTAYWPIILAMSLSTLAIAVSFRAVCGTIEPNRKMVAPLLVLWGSFQRHNATALQVPFV